MMVQTFVSEAGHNQPEDCVTERWGELSYPKWPLVDSPIRRNGKVYRVRKLVLGPPAGVSRVTLNGQAGDGQELKPALYLEEIG
jgi:hypothetical protein